MIPGDPPTNSENSMRSSRHELPVSELTRQAFRRDGFVVARSLIDETVCRDVAVAVRGQLDPLLGPAEFEADVGYPGAPTSLEVEGGATPRRLLHAFSRGKLGDLALDPKIGNYLHSLLHEDAIFMSQCHHNCVMTKHPGYSSATHWLSLIHI